jgi:Eukaryotic aspartyl protease
MDGIVGLGRLQNVADNSEGVKAPTLVDVLVSQNVISSKQIGIHLSGGADTLNDGEITFGAADTSVIDGALSYVAALDNDDGFWEVPVAGANVNGKPAAIQQGVTAILDSGTSFMLLPPADADALNIQIPGAVANGETYTVPCDASASVTVTIAGQQWAIDPKNYVGVQSGDACLSNIVAHQTFGATQWLLGETFLKNVYTLFDNDGARVGFGNLKSESLTPPHVAMLLTSGRQFCVCKHQGRQLHRLVRRPRLGDVEAGLQRLRGGAAGGRRVRMRSAARGVGVGASAGYTRRPLKGYGEDRRK